VIIGEIVIAAGLFLLIPWKPPERKMDEKAA
jgi:hypothetical protein